MAGLVPAIHVLAHQKEYVDARPRLPEVIEFYENA